MTITQMLGQSGLLTLMGMCVVFGFIIILIACMKVLHLVIHALKLDKEEPVEDKTTLVTKTDDGAVVAAIAAAIRSKQKS